MSVSSSTDISRYPIAEIKDVPEDIREAILEVQERSGFVPHVFLLLASKPNVFRGFFSLREALVEEGGTLTAAEREMIVVTTSGINDCLYCVVSHGATLRVRAKAPLLADQLAINYRKADLSERHRAMLDFAVKTTERSAEIEQEDFDTLARYGFDLEDAWVIGSIAAFYALSNRLANFTGLMPNREFYTIGR